MSSATAIQKSPVSITVKITDGPHAGESFSMKKDVISIGRGAENDIVLPNDPKLSRNHIKILCNQDLVTIENLSVRNPILYKDTYEHKIEPNPKDKIRIGETEIQVIWEALPGERTVRVGAETLAQIIAEKTFVQVESKETVMSPVMEPNIPDPLVPVPALNAAAKPTVENKIVDFKGANLGKGGVPEVRYTPTSGGLTNPFKPTLATPTPINTPPQNRSTRKTQQRESSSSSGPIMLIVVAVIIVVGLVMMPDENKKTKKPAQLKDTDQIATELGKSAQIVEQHVRDKHLTNDGRMERQFESAQSYYIKGFRDYRQGQYGRAIMSFQASLSFDPNHTLSRKYLNQSIKKQSGIIQFNLDQARRYRLKNYFRLCRSAAQQVMILRKDQNDPQYKNAKAIFDECDTLSKGRF